MATTQAKLFKIASQINIGRDAIVEYLSSKGFKVENKATTVLTDEQVDLIIEKFAKELKVAEKQREKMHRQQEVRKTLQEKGNAVSIDSMAQQHERQLEIEDRLEHGDPTPAPQAPEVQPTVAPPVEEVSHSVATESVPVEAVVPTPDVAESKEHVASPPQATDVSEAVASEKQEEKPDTGHAVGAKIDLKAVRAKAKQPPGGWNEKELKASTQTTFREPAKPQSPKAQPLTQGKGAPTPPATPTPPAAPAPQANPSTADAAKAAAEAHAETEKKKRPRKNVIEVQLQQGPGGHQLKGLTVLGKIDLAPKVEPRPRQTRDDRGPRSGGGARPPHGANKGTIGDAMAARGPRPQTTGSPSTGAGPGSTGGGMGPNKKPASAAAKALADKKKRKNTKGMRETVSSTDVDRAIRATLSGLEVAAGSRNKSKKMRRMVREEKEAQRQEDLARESSVLRLSEFVTTADLANMMRVTAADIIMKCMALGLMVSINQRLDKDTITLIASDYDFEVDFVDDQSSQDVEEIEDAEETLRSRPPIVTIMGHVDHGKTSLLDYIRNANVVSGEAGGITQHIGAYSVKRPDGRSITFLDTPGHEAFTAMRARGAQVTDIVVLVVAADDSVMPQTIEAISHAQAANVPIVVAMNKIDRADANPDRIRQQLADHGVLVEEWGGKYQSAEISAKSGLNVETLLEKILLEADILNLMANPDRTARGTVIEAHVDKGRGNVVTVIVQKGTLNVGDIFVVGQHSGRVRAMFDERGDRIDSAGPAEPAQVTGFDGLPNAGDILIEMETDAEARDVATRRQQLRREQQFRGMRHLTLDDISAQIQQGGVKELRLVVKGDVSGSVEALSDSLQKLSTQEVKVRILYKAVGTITESDIMLASASDAIVVGFQVTIPTQARKVAETEEVDVRLYSIIYDCINEVQLALEGMLTPDIKEEITAVVEVRATFKISRLGTIAGCYVQSGKITRNDRVRVLREGFEIYKGTLNSLKRIKDDVREVDAGYECGIGINGFNDIQEGDIVEAYKTVEIKRKLA
ncbi:MAG: translation initiation factor IF-2 [bacterium]|nr:translation initiation factor IF-2 [bacterium]